MPNHSLLLVRHALPAHVADRSARRWIWLLCWALSLVASCDRDTPQGGKLVPADASDDAGADGLIGDADTKLGPDMVADGDANIGSDVLVVTDVAEDTLDVLDGEEDTPDTPDGSDVIAATDVIADTDSNAGTDVSADTDSSAETDAGEATDAGAGTDASAETDVLAKTDVLAESDVVAQTDALAATDTEAGTDATEGTDGQALPDADTTTEADTQAQPDALDDSAGADATGAAGSDTEQEQDADPADLDTAAQDTQDEFDSELPPDCVHGSDCTGTLAVCMQWACEAGDCVETLAALGEPCEDGEPCTVADTCSVFALCIGVTATCDDGDLCTDDSCALGLGCTATATDCDDANACTWDSCEAASGCASVLAICDDSDACTSDSCDPVAGCVTATVTCDDGDACTTASCDAVAGCLAATVTCDDGDACTTDSCDAVAGCLAVTVTCDDSDPCTGTESCDAVTGCKAGTPPLCDDSDACNGAETCEAGVGCMPGNPPVCSDGNLCNGTESCDAAEGCQAGTPLVCQDGNVCNGQETCGSSVGCLAGTPLACNDGDPCNGMETCDAAVGCQAGSPVQCDDDDVCNGLETCTTTGSCKEGTAMGCNDNDACTSDYCQSPGGCQHPAVNCDDNNACTTDGCDPVSGCSHTACNDNNLCTSDSCVGGSCVFTSPYMCSDPLNYAGFSGRASEWNLVGHAAVSDSVLRITPAATNQQGGAWTSSKVSVQQGFVATFVFDFATTSGIGGDGMAFVVQADSNTLSSSELGPAFGLKVVLDSFQNGGENSAKRIVVRGGTATLATVDLTGDWTGSGTHTAVISYSPGSLTVQVDGTTHVNQLAVDLSSLNKGVDSDGKAWVGFTARTGGAFEAHDVLSLSVVPACPSGGCGDGNGCTTDSCTAQAGCTSAAPCQDNDACTTDSCDATLGTCSHVLVNCDDGDTCTLDSCSAVSGCSNSVIGSGGDVDGDGVCGSLDPCPLAANNDSNNNGICDDIDFCTIQSAMTLSVSNPVTGQPVQFNFATLFELQFDDLVGDMSFTNGSKTVTGTIGANIVKKGEIWTATSNMSLPGTTCPPKVIQFTVGNHVPVCKTVVITPGLPTAADQLACNCTYAEDKDSDITSYGCVFTDQAGTVLPSSACKLPASETTNGQRVTCAITPSDDAGPGVAGTASVTIGSNQAPIGSNSWQLVMSDLVSNRSLTDLVYCYEENDPYAPLVNSASYGDPDLIFSTYRFRWTVNGVDAGTTTNSVSPLGSTTLQDLYTTASTNGGVALTYKQGDTVGCKMDLWDGLAASTASATTTRQVSGIAPTVDGMTLTPSDFGAYETVTCNAMLQSLDGDALTYRMTVRQASSGGGSTTRYDSGTLAYDPDAAVPFTVSASIVADLAFGSQITCEITVTDDDGSDASGYSVAIPAARPRVSGLSVSSANSSSCDSFFCQGTVTDADTAAVGVTQNADVEVTFLVDGVAVGQQTVSVWGITSSGKTFAASATDLTVTAGSNVSCSARATNTAANLWSSSVSAAALTVSGSPPSYAAAVLTAPAVPLTQDVLTCSASAPLSACAATATPVYSWYQNGSVLNNATSSSLDTSGLVPGVQIHCGVQARSGSVLGPVVASNSVTLGTGDWTLTGGVSGDRAGFSVAVVDDVNGDGVAEVAVGAPNAAPGGVTSAGSVYLVGGSLSGGTQTLASAALKTWNGESGSWDTTTAFCAAYDDGCTPEPAGDTVHAEEGPIGDGLGVRVLAPGDVDGDEVGDVVLSAPYAKASGGYRGGRVYVLSGVGLLATTPASVSSGAATVGFAIDGEDGIDLQVAAAGGTNLSGDLFGFGLAAGDVDGDGLQDLTVGSPHFGTALTDVAWGTPEYNDAGGDTGKVYTVFGSAGLNGLHWLVPALAGETSLRQRTLTGHTLLNFFAPEWGGDLAGLADLNGDGRDEAYVGFLGLAYRGFVLPGTAAPGSVNSQTSPVSDLWPMPYDNWDWNPVGGASFLQQVEAGHLPLYAFPSAAGDVNADGYGDVVVPWWAKQTDGSTQVELTVHFGSADLTGLSLAGPLAGQGGFVVRGTPAEGSVGGAVDTAPVGDVNGDGCDDLAFWLRPRTGTTNASFSRVYVVYGKADTATVTLAQLEAGTGGFVRNAGGLVAWGGVSGGDVNGDGLSELLVGVYGYDNERGRVEVRFGRDTGAITHRGTTGDDALTGTAAANALVGDRGADTLNGGGGADVLLGGAGNDRLVVSDGQFRRVRGGSGTDTLVVQTAAVNLTAMRGRLQDIEVIELSSGSQTLTLASTDIRRLSTSANRLIVLGDSGDSVLTTEGNWQSDGPTVWQGLVLHQYRDGRTLLLIQDGVQTQLPPVFATSSLSVAENSTNGTLIGAVQAVDPDGQVAQLSFAEADSGIFGFDAATGHLTVVDGSVLNHETTPSRTIHVTAVDDDGNSTTGTIVVTITDVPEPPVFAVLAPTGVVEEGSATGTHVASVPASDPDSGDVLTYSLEAGNSDGAFAISATGVVTVADGFALDYETAPYREIQVRVSDQTGLLADVLLGVVVSDLETFEQTATYTFSTIGQGFFSQAPSMTMDFGVAGGLDIGNGAADPLSKSLSAPPFFTGSGTLWSDGKFDWSALAKMSTGTLNASIPVDVVVEFPDSISTGVPFAIQTNWSMGSAAKFYGTAPKFTIGTYYDMEDFEVGGQMNLQTAFGGTGSNTKTFGSGKYTGTGDFEVGVGGDEVSSIRFADAYPSGTSVGPDNAQSALGHMAKALGLGDPADSTIAINKPNLLMIPSYDSGLYDSYYDWDTWLRESLPLYASSTSGKLAYTLTGVDFLLNWGILQGWMYLWLGIEHGYYLDAENVLVTIALENGQVVQVYAGETANVTLQAGADVNGDGRVSVSASFSLVARLYAYTEPYWRYDSYQNWGWATLKSSRQDINEFSGQPYTRTIRTDSWGPLVSWGFTVQQNFDGQVAEGAPDLPNDTEMKAVITTNQQAFEPKNFLLGGWNVPVMSGAIQLSK